MHDDLTYKINGCLFKVYNALGNVWNENVYEKALQLELQAQGLHAECQKAFEVFYFEKRVGSYRIDLLVEDTIVVELKAVPEIFPLHQAQLISYLKGYHKPVGILANFGGTSLAHQTFPNRLDMKNAVEDRFDYEKLALKHKERIKDLLFMANRVFITLGAGYFHQIYRRALYYELQAANGTFEVIKEVTASYRHTSLGSKEVNFWFFGSSRVCQFIVSSMQNVTYFNMLMKVIHLSGQDFC